MEILKEYIAKTEATIKEMEGWIEDHIAVKDYVKAAMTSERMGAAKAIIRDLKDILDEQI